MPVPSWNSPVLKWLDAESVLQAVKTWAEQLFAQNPDVLRVGLFGSYARGDWGVGSDIDLVVILRDTDIPFVERARYFNTADLPLSTDLLVYTEAEWSKMLVQGHFAPGIEGEARWFERDQDSRSSSSQGAPWVEEKLLSTVSRRAYNGAR